MSKKLFTLLLSLVLCLAFASTALGEDFGRFSMDLAEGWSAGDAGDGVTVLFVNEEGESFTITVASLEGGTLEGAASQISQAYKGSPPEEIEEGVWAFAFDHNGVTSAVMMLDAGDRYVLVSSASDNDDIEAMLDTLELN